MPEKDHNVVGMEARQLWERGYEQLEKKQWDYAMELLCMAVEKDPGSQPASLKPSEVSVALSSQIGGFAVDARVSAYLQEDFVPSLRLAGIKDVVDVNDISSASFDLKQINKLCRTLLFKIPIIHQLFYLA